MWMLHAWYYKRKAAQFSDCLCECCMIFHKKSQVLRLFMWMLHDTLKESQEDSSSQIVYVNVTRYCQRIAKFSDCLCECYMIF
jgi:predicted nucleic-acid-binding protein